MAASGLARLSTQADRQPCLRRYYFGSGEALLGMMKRLTINVTGFNLTPKVIDPLGYEVGASPPAVRASHPDGAELRKAPRLGQTP